MTPRPGRTLAVALVLGVVGVLVPAPGSSQQASPPTRSAAEVQDRPMPQGMTDRQTMMNRVQREYEQLLVREMGLSPEQLRGLREVFGEFHGPRMELMRERREIGAALRGLERGSRSEARARDLIDRSRALRARELDLQRQEEERLLEFLSPTQLLQLHRAREAFAERIRRLESGSPMRRGGPPGTGGGGWDEHGHIHR